MNSSRGNTKCRRSPKGASLSQALCGCHCRTRSAPTDSRSQCPGNAAKHWSSPDISPARAVGGLSNRMELIVGGWYRANDNLSENGAPLTVPCQSQWTVNRGASTYRHDAQYISQLRLCLDNLLLLTSVCAEARCLRRLLSRRPGRLPHTPST